MTWTYSGERHIREVTCGCCDSVAERTWTSLDRDGTQRAVCYATCYHHQGGEVYFDVVIGSWGTDDFSDHVTFGCRWGAVVDQPGPMCSLTTGGKVFGDSPLFGTKLDRPAALVHPLLAEFWDIVDFLLLTDPVVMPFTTAHEQGLTGTMSS